MKPERDIKKLPKWAQQEIGRLTRDLESARDKLTAGPDVSDTFSDPYSNPRPLGKGTRIEFRGTKGSFHVSIENDKLEIYGGDSLAVHPRSSNVIVLKLERI